jgi:3-vinyl bacteriochlorophyllide hydratase
MQNNPWDWPSLASDTFASARYAASQRSARASHKSSFLSNGLDSLIERIAPCPWTASCGAPHTLERPLPRRTHLYTSVERQRRDSTAWTTVQAVLAPIQFAVFLVSLGLVLNYLANGRGYEIATASVVLKTFVLYTIMVTGAIWEKKVFGKYLFADAFFWEDAMSMLVIALHTAYLAALIKGWGTAEARMILALAAYGAYAVNAAQFILKLRAARQESPQHLAGGRAI